ncbi:hypothetical protein DH2020_016133 [Rehmannia glutinosa]|uniref:Uncharacterized protein n=1 Tax=Rehmannia glutinosa TaxID=99300 RepID=A0ABR0WX73_REHGL
MSEADQSHEDETKLVNAGRRHVSKNGCSIQQRASQLVPHNSQTQSNSRKWNSKHTNSHKFKIHRLPRNNTTQPTTKLPSNIDQRRQNGPGPVELVRPKPPASEWVISIKEKLDQAQNDEAASAWAKLCIYKIPQCLREGDDNKAYIPQTVSLGPYHHGKKRLRNMDRHKWRALHHILKRANQEIELYLDAIKELEEKARACYEGPICLSSNEFVEMMVLDSCFVLELFRGAAGGFTALGYSRNDPVFSMRGTMHSIQRDMIMLENQIPLFILDKLFGIQSGNPDQKGVVARLALRFFDPLMPTDAPLTKSDRNKLELSLGYETTFDPLTEQGGLHCLEVFRRSLLTIRPGQNRLPVWIKRWSHNNRVADKRRQQLIHCVTELKDAGIKFKKRKTDRFWDIKFANGILKIRVS